MALVISIIVAAFILFFAVKGGIEGFFKIALSTFSLILTIVLAAVLMTPLTNFLVENTEIRNAVEGKIEKGLGWKDSDDEVLNDDNPGSENWEEILSSASREDIEAFLKEAGVKNAEEVSEKISGSAGENSVAAAEDEIIEGLSFPDILKKALKEKNTAEEYVKMGVTNFKQYVVRSVADLIIKIIVFIVLVIVIYILIRLLLVLSKIITSIPVVHGINKLFGFLLGVIEGLLFVWLICFIITLIVGTSFGLKIVALIHESTFLTYLYDNNWLLVGINKLFSMF